MPTRELCLRWTVDTRSRPTGELYSSAVRCPSGEWRFCYYYGVFHNLRLEKVVLFAPLHDPFDVSVQVEGGGTELSRKKRCTHDDASVKQEGKVYRWLIWIESDSDVDRCCPEFRRDPHLRFVVVIRGGDNDLILTDVNLTTEGIGKSTSTASTSVQTECYRTASTSVQTECFRTASTSVQTTLLPSTCLESLLDDLAKCMDGSSHPDVEFLCGGQSTRAHSLVACARSPVIAAMLSSDMVEGKTRVVKIPDMQPEVFGHFLRYMYTGTLPDLTPELAMDLYESGDQYAVLGLARRCAQFLLEHLSVQNACDVLVVADAHSNAEFKEAVVDFMVEKNVPRVFGGWRKFCRIHCTLANEVFNRIYNVAEDSDDSIH